jgi:hypothetical protein
MITIVHGFGWFSENEMGKNISGALLESNPTYNDLTYTIRRSFSAIITG